LRILSIKQPWASLIVLGHKPVENRVWTTSYRGDVLVHASLRPDQNGVSALERCLPTTNLNRLPYGQIIGVVEVYDVVPPGRLPDPAIEWFVGPFGFVLRNARQFKNGIPYSGQLGLVECPPHIERLVRPLL
jgi:hypothetical protein